MHTEGCKAIIIIIIIVVVVVFVVVIVTIIVTVVVIMFSSSKQKYTLMTGTKTKAQNAIATRVGTSITHHMGK
nr:hypothetical protein BaRGS_005244 [Batillaria attramentaria]